MNNTVARRLVSRSTGATGQRETRLETRTRPSTSPLPRATPTRDRPPDQRLVRGPAERKHPPRARRPILPRTDSAVLSAMAGLTSEFGMGSGDPRLHGRARGGCSRGHCLPRPGGSAPPWRSHSAASRIAERGCPDLHVKKSSGY